MQAASEGYGPACLQLGHLHARAESGGSTSSATDWYRRAAEAGSAEAQVIVGRRYQSAWCSEQDDEQALHWYGRAAAQGDEEGREAHATFTALLTARASRFQRRMREA